MIRARFYDDLKVSAEAATEARQASKRKRNIRQRERKKLVKQQQQQQAKVDELLTKAEAYLEATKATPAATPEVNRGEYHAPQGCSLLPKIVSR
jgi:hypothetical protein